jgi:hypothetical protein
MILSKPAKRPSKLKRRISKRSKKDTLLRRLKAKAWKLWSEDVRRSGSLYGDQDCYACRKTFKWRDMHAAHFIHGRLDYDSMNVKPCCAACNTYKHGNLGAYAMHLVEDYGEREVQYLIQRAAQHPGYTVAELEQIISNLEGK